MISKQKALDMLPLFLELTVPTQRLRDLELVKQSELAEDS